MKRLSPYHIRVAALLACCAPAGAAEVWRVRVEEPTGLERRSGEIVALPLARLGGHTAGFTVLDPEGKELPWQVSSGELLFPVSLMPGELPEHRVACCTRGAAPRFANGILARRVGLARVEIGNARFRAVIDAGVPAIVEAYPLSAGPQRALNAVETTPESRARLSGDVHEESPEAKRALPDPVPGVEGENIGWTSLGGEGPMTGVEVLESGPLRGRVRLSRAGEAWELIWTAGGGALRWRARRGFRFTAVSAAPYLPFDRFVGGSEYGWPTGPGEPEPPDHAVVPRAWRKLPGGHAVYYRHHENYGALGIVALDAALEWTGAGSRRFLARKPEGETEIALTFPAWRGGETVLEARRENRVLRHPVLVSVTGPTREPARATATAPRQPAATVDSGAASPFLRQSLSLDGAWELAWAEKGAGPPASGWRIVQVPGSVHPQWLDPAQLYTREAEWLSTKEWWYRRTFELPPAFAGKRLRLQFDATDYYADTYLNGRRIGRHEGYIDPHEYDVTGVVRAGANRLEVRVWTPVSYYWKHRPYTVKGAYGAVDQKPDDITALGITRPVRIVASSAAILKDVAVDTRLTAGGAEVTVQVEAEGEGPYTFEAALAPRNFSSPERWRARSASPHLTIPVKDPKLWWTWDHGRPNLYTLEVRLLDGAGKAIDGRSLAVGIREVEKIGWNFHLNRKRLFIRGTNYYYHLFLSEMDRARHARDLDLMLGMNVNMIRVHCHFSNPEFYELADERGVLVWQDFLEAWHPHDEAFARRAAALYDNHVRYVRNHASVALWAASDEEDFENYRVLTKHLAARPALLDPQMRPVVRSTGRFGDSHVYYGWYGGSIWDYAKLDRDFVSEMGATALPNYPTLVKFMAGRWPIAEHAAEWKWRRLQVEEALRAWGDPGGMTLEEYVPRTQAYVARLFQLAIERMRRRKAEGAGGVMHFHAIDIWPSVTMAAIDFDRVPTRVYETVRRSFAPVAANFEYNRDRWHPGETFECGMWAINDRWTAVAGARVEWRIVDGAGAERARGSFPAAMPPDAARKVGDVRWRTAAAGAHQLRARVLDAAGREISENVFDWEVR